MAVLLLFLCTAAMVSAQGPGFGSCPDKYIPMADFDFSRYLGVWYEAERSWTLLEAGSKCVKINYTQTSDKKVHVQNEQINRLTGIKRVLEGEMKQVGKTAEGKINIKYSIPIPLEATYNVLKTDYETYSVIHYCRSMGLFNAQFAWIMTRERKPPGPVIQSAYGVLDEFDISRNFFVKTEQENCDIVSIDPDVVPSNPDSEARSPSKELLPPEPSKNKNEFLQNDPNVPSKAIEDKKESTLEEKPAETIAESIKEEVTAKKDEKKV